MLSMIQVQVQKFFIPFINFFPPPPLATHALQVHNIPFITTFLLSNFPPPWQPMLSMIQVQVQHSFYQIFPPLATHALRPYLTTFLLSNFPPPLATHAFNDSSSSTTFLLSNSQQPSPPLATHAFNDSGFYGFTPVVIHTPGVAFNRDSQKYSSATLPNYCFPSTVPNTGRVTQHTIYSQT